jgi:menaquinone-9 beta-reductase
VTRDVVIVGAGPAGSSAAAALARRGRDVLLLDRAEFPRDKPCGDGIPPGTVAILNDLGMGPALEGAGFHPIRGIRLVSAHGREWGVSLRPRRPHEDFFIAPRLAFDDLIRRHAVSCGAEFRIAGVRGMIREHGRVTGVRAVVDGVETIISARIVIGADGATSGVARELLSSKPPAHDRAVAIRAYVDGIDTIEGFVELHWYARYAPGYAWIFPMGKTAANVGVIVRADWFKRRSISLDALLEDFLQSADVRRRIGPRAEIRDRATWQLPYATPGAPTRTFDGAMLIGDAGRFVDALTGEGIHHAVASAVIAADVADAALARGDVSRDALAPFDTRCDKELGPLIRRSYAVQKHLAVHPRLVELVFVLGNLGRGAMTRWLNRISTDFVVGVPRGD